MRRFLEGPKAKPAPSPQGKRGARVADELRRAGRAAQRIATEAKKRTRRGGSADPEGAADAVLKGAATLTAPTAAVSTLLRGLSAMGRASISAQRYGKNVNLADGWSSVIATALRKPGASATQIRKLHGNAGKPPLLPRGRGYGKRDHDKRAELRRAYTAGAEIALKLIAKMNPADKAKLAAAINDKAHGSSSGDRVRNFGRWLTGSARSRHPLPHSLARRALAGQLF